MSPPNTHSPVNTSPQTSSGQHYHITTNQSSPINIFTFLREHDGDPAVKVEVILQREHLHIFLLWFLEFHTKTKGSCSFQASESRCHLL
jgi:hypothetical protein